MFCRCCALAWLMTAFAGQCPALGITQPTATTVVVAGDDYASEQLSNPWDMSDTGDIALDESFNVISQSFSGGLFSGTTTVGGDNELFPLFMGFGSSINSSRGYNHPIDTSRYRYLTIKLRETRASANTEVANITFLQSDSFSYNNGACGFTSNLPIAASAAPAWVIHTFDMVTSHQANSTCPHNWLDFPTVAGIRLNPALDGSSPFQGVRVDIDWIRLTSVAAADAKTTVQWTDSGYAGTYSVTINETGANATSLLLGSGIGGTSFVADLSTLTPGQYTVTVSRDVGGTSATSQMFRINSPPQVALTAPDVHGDQTRNFAASVLGNPWGPLTASDFTLVNNFTNVSYSSPVGSFYGRPTSADPQWFMNLANQAIDTKLYRSLCFTLKDFGPRLVGIGSVARFFWGQKTTGNLSISQDIPLNSGLNEYCVADIAAVPIEPQSVGGPWTGTQTEFRLDPHEFPVSAACMSTPSPANCHDVQLDSVVLSPFAEANPGYTFKWNLSDADDGTVNLGLYLDADTNPSNGNELLIHAASVSSTNGQFVWPGSGSVNYGTYQAFVIADDGKNAVTQYATGPIIIGPSDGIFRNGFDLLP